LILSLVFTVFLYSHGAGLKLVPVFAVSQTPHTPTQPPHPTHTPPPPRGCSTSFFSGFFLASPSGPTALPTSVGISGSGFLGCFSQRRVLPQNSPSLFFFRPLQFLSPPTTLRRFLFQFYIIFQMFCPLRLTAASATPSKRI